MRAVRTAPTAKTALTATTGPTAKLAKTAKTAQQALLAGSLTAAVALLGGCGPASSAKPLTGPAAQADGVACRLLDYDSVFWLLGVRFDTAGAASAATTSTCALTQRSQPFPDLTLAVTPTSSDEAIFLATVAPSGSTTVRGLGRIAYQIMKEPSAGVGPGVELGWLSDRSQLMVLRYTLAPGTTPAQSIGIAGRLVSLAQQIELDAA